MALLWGDMPEERASHGLRQALSNLQKLLGPYLLITRQTVAFNQSGAPYYLDTEALLALVREAESAAFGVHRRLRDALDLYAGEFLDGFYVRDAPEFEEWEAGQRERLRALVLDTLQKLATHYAGRGQYRQATAYLKQLVEMDALREDAHRQLMLLLAYLGQPDAAAAQYHACKQAMLIELGEEPAEETAALYKSIRAGTVKAPDGVMPPGNLHREHTPLIGRQTELAQIEALLADPACRVLTLTGPGGIGKTSLALQIATAPCL